LHGGFYTYSLVWEFSRPGEPYGAGLWNVCFPFSSSPLTSAPIQSPFNAFPPFFNLHLTLPLHSYPNQTIWITEYADNNDTLTNTQSFFNSSASYFDRLPYVERYSYFGSFRSDVSNVGPNAAMLTSDGKLTDIGSWYLGGAATNNIPSSTSGAMGRFEGKSVGGLVVAVLAVGILVL
jgi:hypothetical protein